MVPYPDAHHASIFEPVVRVRAHCLRVRLIYQGSFCRGKEDYLGASGGMIVHVVDDDEDVRDGFARLLRSVDLQVRAFATAQQFLDEVDNSASGCVLLDVTMPGITGPEVLVRLKEKCNSLPVIIVSARDNESVHKVVYALGARMFLRKPVDDQALLDAIHWVTTVRTEH